LHLLPDRRSAEQTTFRPAIVDASAMGEAAEPAGRPLTDTTLRDHFAELRRVLVASLDSQSDRLVGDMRALLKGASPGQPATTARAASGMPWGWIVAALVGAVAAASLALWQQAVMARRELAGELAQIPGARAALSHPPPAVDARPAESSAASGLGGDTLPLPSAAGAAVQAVGPVPLGSSSALTPELKPVVPNSRADWRSAIEVKPIVAAVPYGAEPFGGPRLEMLRQLFDRLAAESFRGVVEIKSFPGRFCLAGNTADGFSLAPDDTPFAKCDVIASPPDEMPVQAPRVPLALANLTEAFRTATHGAGDVQLQSGDAATTLVPYPQISDSLTAGEWNRAGSSNNRIEVRTR